MWSSNPLSITAVINCKQSCEIIPKQPYLGERISAPEGTEGKKSLPEGEKVFPRHSTRLPCFLTPLLCDNAPDGELLSRYYPDNMTVMEVEVPQVSAKKDGGQLSCSIRPLYSCFTLRRLRQVCRHPYLHSPQFLLTIQRSVTVQCIVEDGIHGCVCICILVFTMTPAMKIWRAEV